MSHFNISNSTPLLIYHPKLIIPVTGFVKAGISKNCTPGVLIFLPTSKPHDLMKILGVMP